MAQPLRFELADIGEDLIKEGVSPNIERVIRRVLESAFNVRRAWRLLVLFPLAFLPESDSDRAIDDAHQSLTAEQRETISRFYRLGIIVTFANSPLASVIFVFEVIIFAMMVAPIGVAIKRALSHLAGGNHSGRFAH